MNLKKYILPLLLITVAVSSAFVISSCDIKNPTEGIEVFLNTKTRETLVGAYIYNATTNDAINQTVKLTFSGANASNIIDETNEAKTTFTTKNGALIFGVKDGTTFSENAPFKVTATIESSGYETRVEVIELYAKGFQSYDFYLVNPAQLPSNADQGSTSGTASNGTTTSAIVLNTNGGTSVNVPAGTSLTTTTGTPLTGNITVNVTSVPITSQNANTVPKTLSTSATSTIAPAVSVSLNVTDQSGNSASTNVEANIPIAPGIVNPRTGAEYQAGDTMEIYVFNTATGLWEKQGEGTITSTLAKNSLRKTNATLVLVITIPTGKVIVVGNSQGNCKAGFVIAGAPSGFNYSSLKFYKSDGTELNVNHKGNGTYIAVIPDAGLNNVQVKLNGTILLNNLQLSCTSAPVYTVSSLASTISVNLNITGKCTAKDPVVTVNPNAAFSYKKVGTSTWTGGNLVNGIATLSGLEVGSTYEITASYRGNEGNAQFKVNSSGSFQIVQVSDPGKILSQSINTSTSPQQVVMVIDIGNECD